MLQYQAEQDVLILLLLESLINGCDEQNRLRLPKQNNRMEG